MKTTYFLFGQQVCQLFLELDSIDELIDLINDENIDYGLFEFIPNETSVIDLMYKYHGYMDYCVITKEEYDKLNSI
jgi:hypothetical protein